MGAAVSNNEVNAGVVPIENSLEGSVTFTLDLLIAQSGLSIQNEVVIHIDHYLVAAPGVAAESVEVIYSPPRRPWPSAGSTWKRAFPRLRAKHP